MAEKKQDTGFTVTDRRLFTTEGELRADLPEEKQEPSVPVATAPSAAATAVATPPEAAPADTAETKVPPPPSAAEQKASDDAYQQSSKDLDARVELSGHSAKDQGQSHRD